MAVTKTGSAEKRRKRTEKMAASERLTNGFMLCLTYGLGGIVLLEIVRRHYLMYLNQFNMNALGFASKFCIVLGVLFAVGAAVMAVLGAVKKINCGKSVCYTVFFAVSSVLSFFLSYDVRVPISAKMLASKEYWGGLDFLANLNLAQDAKWVEYGVVAFLVVAFIVYAIRLAKIEKKK